MRPARLRLAVAFACALVASAAGAQEVSPPSAPDSVQFLAVGDTGTGDSAQQQVAAMITKARDAFPFTFAILLGDNLYGAERPQDYKTKFENPGTRPLLDAASSSTRRSATTTTRISASTSRST